MKTIFTLIGSFLVTTSTFAATPSASITVKSDKKADIIVVVDQQRYDLGSPSIMISDLDPCEHQVIVYEELSAASVNCFQKNYEMVFNSPVELKPRTNLQIDIDECGVITMNEKRFRSRERFDDWQGDSEYRPEPFVGSGIYSKAIADLDFSRVLWAIGKEGSENNRMKSAEQIIHTNYFTPAQVGQLLQLFNVEANKLELAKMAQGKTVDQSNYAVVVRQ